MYVPNRYTHTASGTGTGTHPCIKVYAHTASRTVTGALMHKWYCFRHWYWYCKGLHSSCFKHWYWYPSMHKGPHSYCFRHWNWYPSIHKGLRSYRFRHWYWYLPVQYRPTVIPLALVLVPLLLRNCPSARCHIPLQTSTHSRSSLSNQQCESCVALKAQLHGTY